MPEQKPVKRKINSLDEDGKIIARETGDTLPEGQGGEDNSEKPVVTLPQWTKIMDMTKNFDPNDNPSKE